MIRQLTTPETGHDHDEGPPHTNTHSQGSLSSNRDHVTTRGSRIQTNKEISPLLTKCGEIPHKNYFRLSNHFPKQSWIVHQSSPSEKSTKKQDPEGASKKNKRYDSTHFGSMVVQAYNTHSRTIQGTRTLKGNNALHRELDHCAIERILRPVQCF